MRLPSGGIVVLKKIYHVYLEPEEMATLHELPLEEQIGYIAESPSDLMEAEILSIDYD